MSRTLMNLVANLPSGPVLDAALERTGLTGLHVARAAPGDALARKFARTGTAYDVERLVRLLKSPEVLAEVFAKNKRKGVRAELLSNPHLPLEAAAGAAYEALRSRRVNEFREVLATRSLPEQWQLLNTLVPADASDEVQGYLRRLALTHPCRPFEQVVPEYREAVRAERYEDARRVLQSRPSRERFDLMASESARWAGWPKMLVEAAVSTQDAGVLERACALVDDHDQLLSLLEAAASAQLWTCASTVLAKASETARTTRYGKDLDAALGARLAEALRGSCSDLLRVASLSPDAAKRVLEMVLAREVDLDPLQVLRTLPEHRRGSVLESLVRSNEVISADLAQLVLDANDQYAISTIMRQASRTTPGSRALLVKRVDRQYAALLIGHHESTTELKELLESRVDAIPSDVTKEALTELLELGISDERLVPLLRTYDLHLGSPLRACALRCAPPSLLSRLGDLTEDELTSLVERFAKVEMTYSEGTWLVNRARSLEQRKTLLAGHPELVSALMGADCSRDDLEPLLEVPGVQEAWESSALSALGRGAPDWASLAFDRLELPWAALHADLFAEVAQQLLGALGDDLQAWDTAISLLGSWEGTLADLVETCTGV